MSYRNPQRVIDNRMNTINQGIQASLTSITKSRQAFAAAEKQKLDRAQVALGKVSTRAQISFDDSYQRAKTAADTFTSGLSNKEGKSTKDAIKFSAQIEDILSSIGNDLNNQILEIQERGGSADEINRVKNTAITKMNKFTNDMANWEAARMEYMKASQIPEGEPGSLVAIAKLQGNNNNSLITMFQRMLDDKEDNLYISIDPDNGNTRISQGGMTTTGSGANKVTTFNPRTTSDITVFAAKAEKDGYFLENEEFNAENYNDMQTMIGELKGEKDLLIDGKNELDKDKVRDYFFGRETTTTGGGTTTIDPNPAGVTFLNSYRHEPEYWASIGVENEEEYLDKVFNVGFDLYFNNTRENIANNRDAQTIQ